jgi:hypothetical protein
VSRGITNGQARMLASLQRQLGLPYTGNGLSSADAAKTIDACLTALGREPRAPGERTGRTMFRSRRLDARIRREREQAKS